MSKGIFGILLAAAMLLANIDFIAADVKMWNARAEESVALFQVSGQGQEDSNMSFHEFHGIDGSADCSGIREKKDHILKNVDEIYALQMKPGDGLQSVYVMSRILLQILLWLKKIIIWVILM